VPSEIKEISKLFEEKGAYENFAKAFPDRKMTPAEVTLIKQRPDLAAKVIQNGRMNDVSRQFFTQNDSGTIGASENPLILALNCNLGDFDDKRRLFCNAINENLFSEDDPTQDAAVDALLAQDWHFFIKDGLNRLEIPNMTLPGEISVSGNGKCGHNPHIKGYFQEIYGDPIVERETGRKVKFYKGDRECVYDKKEYLKYLLGKFKKAYGDKALQAFYVYMQNFTGSGNTSHGAAAFMVIVGENLSNLYAVINGTNLHGERHVTMTMDENFNATYDIIFDIMPETYKELLRNDERRKNTSGLEGIDMNDPHLIFNFDANEVVVVAIHSYIPAAHNTDGADLYEQYDQRPNRGKQETNMSIIVSSPPK
jgi:hypothetical protein